MRLERRKRSPAPGKVKMNLILVAETPEESAIIDECLGKVVQDDDGLISVVVGEVRLSDGYGEHYITLEKADAKA